MAKKKKTTEAAVAVKEPVAPLSGKDLFAKTKNAVTPFPVKYEELAPIVPKKRDKLKSSDTLANHLHLLEVYSVLSVAEFRDYSNTGDLAKDVLLGLEAAGYAESSWKKGKTVFTLTDAGKAKLDEAST